MRSDESFAAALQAQEAYAEAGAKSWGNLKTYEDINKRYQKIKKYMHIFSSCGHCAKIITLTPLDLNYLAWQQSTTRC